MGGGLGKSASEIEAEEASMRIEMEQMANAITSVYQFKILLLGAGESGKSTVLKQLKNIHQMKIDEQDWKLCSRSLHANAHVCIQNVLKEADNMNAAESKNEGDRSFLDAQDQATAKMIDEWREDGGKFTLDQGKAILRLFSCGPMQAAWNRRDTYYIPDSAQYYFDNLLRFCKDPFTPTEMDYLTYRVRTTGLIQTLLERKINKSDDKKDAEVEPEKIHFNLFDVGGQRSERTKWARCFDPPSVDAVLFIVNCAGYNQVMFEDPTRNRLEEEIAVFGDLIKKKTAQGIPIFIFLNKKDLFEKMILEKDLGDKFPDYRGGKSSQEALEYIKKRFTEQYGENPKELLKIEFVTAKVKKDIRDAFDTVYQTLFVQKRPQLASKARDIRTASEQQIQELKKANGSGCC